MSDETAKTVASVAPETTEHQADAMVVDDTAPTPTADKSSSSDAQETSKKQTNGAEGPQGAKAPADADDTEMSGTGAVDNADGSTAEDASGATDKKIRRKSAGVPEHKTKKTLKHKKSVKDLHLDAKPGELFLSRMKGHAAWPSIVADNDMLPAVIEAKRPVTAPNLDGTWKREEYAPGGKRQHERTFPVLFLHTNEFAWIPNVDLQPLTVDECKDVSEKSKSKALIAAYEEAAKGRALSHYKDLLNDHADAVAEEEAARAEQQAEKARKAEKKVKRKSDAAVATDADEMEVDDDSTGTKAKGKKRKKDAADGDGNEKPAKTPKTTKLKLSNPKTPATGEKSSKKKEAGTKSANKKKTPAKGPVDSDEAETPAPEKELTAEEKYAKREQEVKYCRHKLQRGLLTRDNVPTDDEVKTMSTYLKKLEDYPELEASIIRATKIHKVLRAMIKLQTIPRDDEYNFKTRSVELLAKWNKVLAADDKNEADSEKKESAPTTNGDAKSIHNDSDKKVVTKDEEDKAEKSDNPASKAEEKNGGDDTTESKDTSASNAAAPTVEVGSNVEAGKAAPSTADSQSDVPNASDKPVENSEPGAETVEPTSAS